MPRFLRLLPPYAPGLLLALLAVLVLWLLSRTTYAPPNPSAILLLVVAYGAYSGRAAGGLLGALVGLLYLAGSFGTLDGVYRLSLGDVRRIATYAAAAVVITLTMTRVRDSLDRLYFREREARRRAEAAERRALFLSEVSRLLGVSLDYMTSLRSIARIAVSVLADWCIVYIIQDDGTVLRRAITHADPELRALADRLNDYPVDQNRMRRLMTLMKAGEPLLFRTMPDALVRDMADGTEQREIVRRLGAESVILAPLITRRRLLGAIACISSRPERHYTEDDVELAAEIGRRTALAVENARLYDDARAADRAKTHFLAVMSHELRTPLTAIIGYVDLLQAGVYGPLEDRLRAPLERVVESSQHLLSLIDEILAYTRTEAGRERIRLEAVDIPGLVRELTAVAEPGARKKGLEFRSSIRGAPRRLVTDAAKLRRILTNLLMNAVVFTERGHVALDVEGNAEGVTFRVSDTGIGIPRELQRKIFAPFYQVEPATTRRHGGTGLGLAIAQRLAELIGGRISVESEPGRGSTFTVHVPWSPPRRARSDAEGRT